MDYDNHSPDIRCRVMNFIRLTACRLASQRAIPGMEREDYQQDLLGDLLHRHKMFDPSRASFPTFADRIVGHRVSTLTSPTLRLKAERSAVSLDASVADEDGDERALIDLIADHTIALDEHAAIRIDVGNFLNALSPGLQQCCEILIDDNVAGGAQAAGLHRSTVYRRITQLRETARRRGLEIYLERSPDTSARTPVGGGDSSGETTDAGGNQENTPVKRHQPICLPVGESELRNWLGQAKPGQSIEYYRGSLAADRVRFGSRLPEPVRAELDRVAKYAYSAAEQGLAHLVQRRHGVDDYSYVLTATKHRDFNTRCLVLAVADDVLIESQS